MNRKIMTSLVIVLLCISMISGGYSMWMVMTVKDPDIGVSGNVVELTVTEAKITTVSASFVAQDSNPGLLLKAEQASAEDDWLKVENKSTVKLTPRQFELSIILISSVKPTGVSWADWNGKDASGKTVKFRVWFSDFQKMDSSQATVDNRTDWTCLKGPDTPTDTNGNPTAYIELWKEGNTWKTVMIKDGENVTDTTERPQGWGTAEFIASEGRLSVTMMTSWGDAFGGNGQDPQTYINSKELYTKKEIETLQAKLDVLASIKKLSIRVNAQVVPVL